MMDINYFRKIQNAYGTRDKREKELARINYNNEKHFRDTFDTETVLRNNEPFDLMIIKDTDANVNKKKIKSPNNAKFNWGDYITWNGQVWLVTLLDTDTKTWCRGYMYLCNVLLRWQNSKGEIVERWGYSEDFTKYSTGTYGNNVATLGDYQYGVTLPVDEETKVIKRDKRFAIDFLDVEPPDVYKLSNRKIFLSDATIINRGGILTWTLSYDFFNPSVDKKVQLKDGNIGWICDYVDTANSPTPPLSTSTTLKASMFGRNNITIGYERKYSVKFKNLIGDEIDYTDFRWNIKCDFVDQLNIETHGTNLRITLTDKSLIGEQFIIQVLHGNEIMTEKTVVISDTY